MRRQGEGKLAFVVHFLIVNELGGGDVGSPGQHANTGKADQWQREAEGGEGGTGVFNEGDP